MVCYTLEDFEIIEGNFQKSPIAIYVYFIKKLEYQSISWSGDKRTIIAFLNLYNIFFAKK